MTPREALVRRVILSSPAVAALLVNLFAHAFAPTALVALVACAIILLGRFEVEHTPGGLAIFGALGAAAGFLTTFLVEIPRGPIPPGLAGPLVGALAGFTVFCVLSRYNLYLWVYASLVVVLSLSSPSSPWLWGALGLFGVSVLAAAWTSAGLGRAGAVWAIPFVALVLGLTLAFSEGLRSLEGRLMALVYNLVKGLPPAGGVGLEAFMQLDDVSSVTPSDRILFQYDGPPTYLRAVVMDAFDGHTWRSSGATGKRIDRREKPAIQGEIRASLFFLEQTNDRWPVPAGTRRVDAGNVFPFDGGLWSGPLVTARPVAVWLDPADALPTEALPVSASTFTEFQPEFAAIGREIVGDAAATLDRARRIERHLTSNFTYSLSTDLTGGRHPLLTLLREKRPAYCVYFAGAMAVLLRSLGEDARVVGGFVPQERDAFGSAFIVRERDAHAWVEVFDRADLRWHRFDPTPGDSRIQAVAPKPGLLARLVRSVGATVRRWWAEFKEDPAAFVLDVASSPGVLVPGGLAAAWLAWRQLRGRRRRVVETVLVAKDPEFGAIHDALEDVARTRAGVEAGPAMSDDELLRRTTAKDAALGGRVGDVVDRYRAQRFGDAPRDAKALAADVDRLRNSR